MRKIRLSILLAVIAALALVQAVPAQDGAELQLRMSKTFGYAAGGEMQGAFTLKASGPETLQRVVFTLDGQPLGEAAEPPFDLTFNTGSYPFGVHTLAAIGYTSDGRELQSNEIQREFVSAEAGWQTAKKLLIPILALVVVIALLSTVFPMLGKKKNQELPAGAPRNYGVAGGAICPRCRRPFALRVMAINLSPLHRYDRCPYCGKWSVLRRKSIDELRAAEQAELVQAQAEAPAPEESAEEKLRKELDRSRYQDL